MKIVFLGDLVPGGVKTNDLQFINNNILDNIKDADLRITTLESPFGGDNIVFDEKTMKYEKNIIYSPVDDVNKLSYLNINVVSLANNHIHNLGENGLEFTIKTLDNLGIKHMGAGKNIKEASKPCIVNVNGMTAAFIGCCATDDFMGFVQVAKDNEYGVNPIDIKIQAGQVKDLKKKYDYVFVLPHWGMERRIFVLNKYKKYACKMIDSGADGVIGCHTHCVQPSINYKGKPICFSLGNFFFPDYYQQPVLPIWYPKEKESVTDLRITSDYYKANDYRKFVWNDFTRIGKIKVVEFSSNNIVKTSENLIKLNSDNVIETYTDDKLIRRLDYIGRWIKSSTYLLIWFYLVLGRKSKHFIRKIGIIK